MSNLSTEWLKNLPSDKKKDFELIIRNSTMMAQRILELCNEWEEELDRAEARVSDYDTPSWGFRQAHRNGDRSRIRKLRDLFSFLHGEDK
jgi:hypothetical protein